MTVPRAVQGGDGQDPVRFYDFSPFRLDPIKRMLLRDGHAVPLTPKAFDILLLLVERRHTIVDKDTLISVIWGGTVVEENNLARNVSTLRKALNETPSEHRYIVTVPGRGYRFVGDVMPVAAMAELSEVSAEVAAPLPAGGTPNVVDPLPSHWWGRLAPFAAVAVVVVGTLVMVGAVLRGGSPSGEPTPSREMWQLTFDGGLQGEPTWSPDGSRVAYSSDRGGNLDIWVQAVEGGNPIRITSSSAHDWQPHWSPDGRYLVFRSERDGGGLYAVPTPGGTEQRVSAFGYQPRWSPDSAQILFHRSNLQGLVVGAREIFAVRLDGQPPREVLRDVVSQFQSFHTTWHPDSRRISVWGLHAKNGLSFWTAPLDGANPIVSEIDPAVRRQLTEAAVTFTDPDGVPLPFLWSPSGDALYFEGLSHGVRNLWKIALDPATLRWRSGPQRLTTGADLNAGISLTADGKRLAFAVQSEHIRLWSFPFDARSGKVLGPGKPITSDSTNALTPEISPDGTRVVFKADRGGHQELRLKWLEDGRESLLVAADTFVRWNPIWLNDGRHVVYARSSPPDGEDAVGQRLIVKVPVDGGGEQVLMPHSSLFELPSDWSADGAWVLGGTQKSSPGRYALALYPADLRGSDDARVQPLESDAGRTLWQARLSRDQQWVSYAAARPGVSTIYARRIGGGTPIAITDGQTFDDRPRWSPDGGTLYFLSNRSGFFNVWGRRFDADRGVPIGDAFPVTSFSSPAQMLPPRMVQLGLALSADRLILPISDVAGNVWILDRVDK